MKHSGVKFLLVSQSWILYYVYLMASKNVDNLAVGEGTATKTDLDLSSWGTAETTSAIAKVGDLIEFSRFGYQHWAVYTGNGEVIHVFLENKGVGGAAQVKKEPLATVCGGSQCRINNLADDAKKKGLKPLPPDVILANAQGNVGLVIKYALTNDNCEFFATSCRYGQSFCQQMDAKQDLLNKITVGGLVIGGLAAIGNFFLSRTQSNGERSYENGNRTRANGNGLEDS